MTTLFFLFSTEEAESVVMSIEKYSTEKKKLRINHRWAAEN